MLGGWSLLVEARCVVYPSPTKKCVNVNNIQIILKNSLDEDEIKIGQEQSDDRGGEVCIVGLDTNTR